MKEKIYKGLGISAGIAIGEAFVLEMSEPVIWMHKIPEDGIEEEVARFSKAVEATKNGLLKIKNRIGKEMGSKHSYIFDAHILMLDDPMLLDEVHNQIRKNRVNAEFALQQVTNELSHTFSAFEDPYLRERGVDVLDVSNRIQWHLCRPVDQQEREPSKPSIFIAHDIPPSKLAAMDSRMLLGLAMDMGGQTSHTGILASAKNIPSVAGLHDISVIAKMGETVIIDGNDGTVITSPKAKTLEKYKFKQKLYQQREEELLGMRDLPAVTTDGVDIRMYANVELKEELHAVFDKYGAQGVGLFRSEFIFLSSPTMMPTEKDHEDMYIQMAQRAGSHPVYLRTIDLGGEKGLESLEIAEEQNPALGLRAVRFGLRRKSLFKAQLKGILRASTNGNIKILLPMISCIEEFRNVRQLLDQCMTELTNDDIPFNENIELGITIEVPSAAITADILAEEADFISVGTNDLIQYTLAIDRGNEAVAYLYDPFHPSVLRMLAMIAEKVQKTGKVLSMCGEMAADPHATPLFIGLGFHELSMNAMSIPVIKTVVRSLEFKNCKSIASEVLSMTSVKGIRRQLKNFVESCCPELKKLLPDSS